MDNTPASSRQGPDRVLAALVGVFLIANIASLAWTGVRSGADSAHYVDGAAQLLEFDALDRIQASHAGYVAVIALCQWAGVGLIGVVLTQIIVGAVAMAVVYQLGFALAGRCAGLFAAGLFACSVETARWHAYVLTDSLYLSLLTICVWHVHRAATAIADSRRMLAAVLLLVLVALARPEGWLVPPLAAMYWGMSETSHAVRRVTALAVAAICATSILLLVPRLPNRVEGVLGVESFLNGRTIWGYDHWTVSMPPEPDLTAQRRGVVGIARYAAAHPAKISALVLARVAVHFADVRPFYSSAHNLVILAWLVPVYVLAILGWRLVASISLARWLATVIAGHTAMVAVTHADWDGRYLAHVLPLIYVFSACGLAYMMRTWRFSRAAADVSHAAV